MKKKIHWGKLTDTDLESDYNQIKVIGEKSDRKLKVKIIDENGNEIKRYQDIKVDKHKISIVMKFQWEVTDYQNASEDNVEYVMKRGDDSWKISEKERVITVIKKNEFDKVWKEMHGDLLKKKFADLLDLRVKVDDTDIEYRISDSEENKGNFQVAIYRQGGSNNRSFAWQKIEIEPKYHLNTEISATDLIKIKYQEIKEVPRQTKIWIIFFIIVSLIIIGLIFFWKKIWNWIRGETKQEKKIREQLDIF
ncbi:MAG: hypothetical protein GBAus27B_000166 [Mycoplasmataceae bacterium]|nr:MAG: hypothetical protein GBAus27B_000166 [Mycoplasmataceae bacterium]